ncbi:uncharacterized protein LOC125469504 isoform X2 [Pyrus x bretschneideri]|uniref:uncharacterized protein LOC125469504 isoform X2 n=1 Tax=Pyrus x bretschneideri TaxID=225117 RepID=UPI00202E7DC9|nr:uncharacterized protein LOC125469504 isoform X2 [Pyrus x bretschneideri]
MIYVVNYCLIDVYSYPFSMPFVFIFLKALWDKALEFRFLLQKAFSSSHRIMDCHRLYLRRTRPLSKQQMVNLDDLGCHSHLRTLMVMRIGHRFLSCIDGDEDWSQISELLSRSLRGTTLQRERDIILFLEKVAC